MTVADANPTNFVQAQQLVTDAIFESLMPTYCGLPENGANCVTNRVQWNIITYGTNGYPMISGCAASGSQFHFCESRPAVANGYITAVLRSECADAPASPPPVGSTKVGSNYVIMTVADANPTNFVQAQQLVTDAIFESLMPTYCGLPENGANCVTNRVQWNIITYGTNGYPMISGCAASGCQFHSCAGALTANGPPTLRIFSRTNSMNLSWSSMDADFLLEESTNLVNWYRVNWSTATNRDSITSEIRSRGSGRFYRLHQK